MARALVWKGLACELLATCASLGAPAAETGIAEGLLTILAAVPGLVLLAAYVARKVVPPHPDSLKG